MFDCAHALWVLHLINSIRDRVWHVGVSLWLLKRCGQFISIICDVVIFHIKQVTLLTQFYSYIQCLAIYLGDGFLLPFDVQRPFYMAGLMYKHI